MTTTAPPIVPAVPFYTTRWTRVCLAKADSEDGRKALADLCEACFWSVTDAARPEIPKGGLVLVWKLTRNFAPGDVIAHAGESKGRVSLGRIDKQSQEAVFVKRNNSEPTSVLHSAIVGKVISVVWRGTQEVSSNSMNLKEWEGKDGAWMYLRGFAPDKGVDPTTYVELKEPLPAKKRHQFLSVNDYAPLFNRQP